MATYNTSFFEGQCTQSSRSAARVVPLVLDLVAARSVVDVGCGVGAWLRAFVDAGIADVTGLDGAWVPLDLLRVPREHFVAADLVSPPKLERRFDLAVSLEVAEHLPPESADRFIAALTALSDVVLFSAAIPGQGGTGHLNEQWPEYWAERFAHHGYRAIDCLRPTLWGDENVEWWYAQNAMIYATEEALMQHPMLAAAARAAAPPAPMIHPSLWELQLSRGRTFRDVLKIAPGALRSAVILRLRRVRVRSSH